MSAIAYFDTGQREQLGEKKTWHGNGWYTDDGSIVFFAGPETQVVVDDDGTAHVFHQRRRCW